MADPEVPLGINVATGSAVIVVASLVSAAVPPSASPVRLGLLAVALGLFAAATVDVVALSLVGVLGFAVFDGFLVDQLGELSWHGAGDLSRLAVLTTAGACGLGAGSAYRAVRRVGLWRAREDLVQAWAREQWVRNER